MEALLKTRVSVRFRRREDKSLQTLKYVAIDAAAGAANFNALEC